MKIFNKTWGKGRWWKFGEGSKKSQDYSWESLCVSYDIFLIWKVWLFLSRGYELGSFKCYRPVLSLQCFLIPSLILFPCSKFRPKGRSLSSVNSFISCGTIADAAWKRGKKFSYCISAVSKYALTFSPLNITVMSYFSHIFIWTYYCPIHNTNWVQRPGKYS